MTQLGPFRTRLEPVLGSDDAWCPIPDEMGWEIGDVIDVTIAHEQLTLHNTSEIALCRSRLRRNSTSLRRRLANPNDSLRRVYRCKRNGDRVLALPATDKPAFKTELSSRTGRWQLVVELHNFTETDIEDDEA